MALIEDVRKNTPTTPFYAAVGVTDLAVEKVRDARVRAEQVATKVRADLAGLQVEFAPAKVQTSVSTRATELVEQAKDFPGVALNQGLVAAGKVAEGYDALALRGKQLVKRVRGQQATKDLVAQAESTVALAKGSVTTARKAVADVERSAKATITTGRKEAAHLVETVTASVMDEAATVTAEVKKSATRTRTAAKRTATTTRNAASRTTTSAKAASTSARKTVASAPKASAKAAAKVGD